MNHERSPLGELLRAHTRQAHADIDQHPLLRPLVSSSITQRHYAVALAALHPLYAVLEPVFGHAFVVGTASFECQQRCPALALDLQSLNAMPSPDRGGLARLAVETPEDQLGILYVLEGSALGGAMILKRLQKNLPSVPVQFFSGNEENSLARWSLFQQFLSQVSGYIEVAQVLAAADRCFVALRRHLDCTMVSDPATASGQSGCFGVVYENHPA